MAENTATPVPRTSNGVVLFSDFLGVPTDAPGSFVENSWDDPDEYCPICNAYHHACFSLPGIGGPYAAS